MSVLIGMVGYITHWDEPPNSTPLVHKAWEKPHLPNLTGTVMGLLLLLVLYEKLRLGRAATMRPGTPSSMMRGIWAEFIAGTCVLIAAVWFAFVAFQRGGWVDADNSYLLNASFRSIEVFRLERMFA